MDGEVWKDIPGYEGYYQVSNYGNVRSVNRVDCRGYNRKGKLLNVQTEQSGYTSVKLCVKGVQKRCKIHRLVADAFIPNIDDLPYINHKDEDKQNNRVDNLEWCTHQYNVNYGTKKQRGSDTFYQKYIQDGYKYTGVDKGSEKRAVLQFDLNGNYIRKFDSVSDATRFIFNTIDIGGKGSPISRCCDGKYKYVYGYIWRYEKDCLDIDLQKGLDIVSLFNLRAECEYCGNEFLQNIKSHNGRRFCSKKCYKKYTAKKLREVTI